LHRSGDGDDGATALQDPGATAVAVVVAGQVVGDLSASLRRSCAELSQLADTPILEVSFVGDAPEHLFFAGASPRPDFRVGGDGVRLEELDAVYTRLMDDGQLPELIAESADSPRRRRCRELHATLMEWYEIAPGRVVNRSRRMATNLSKPYQASLIAGQ